MNTVFDTMKEKMTKTIHALEKEYADFDYPALNQN